MKLPILMCAEKAEN